jgi:hypothetical protein
MPRKPLKGRDDAGRGRLHRVHSVLRLCNGDNGGCGLYVMVLLCLATIAVLYEMLKMEFMPGGSHSRFLAGSCGDHALAMHNFNVKAQCILLTIIYLSIMFVLAIGRVWCDNPCRLRPSVRLISIVSGTKIDPSGSPDSHCATQSAASRQMQK